MLVCNERLYLFFKSYISEAKKEGTDSKLTAELKKVIRFPFLTKVELKEAVTEGFIDQDEFANLYMASVRTDKEQFEFEYEIYGFLPFPVFNDCFVCNCVRKFVTLGF